MENPLVDSYLNESTKLDGKIFMNWKVKMQILMEGYNVWEIVFKDEAKLVALANTHDWDRSKTKEKVLLRMLIKDNIIPHISDFNTSKETCDTLKCLYETTNTNRLVFLKRKLLSIKMEETKNVTKFLSRIKELKDKLGDIGEKISSTYMVNVTLNDMLYGYQMFITILPTREKAPTFDELTWFFLQEEEHKNHIDFRSQSSYLVLVAKGKKP